MPLLSAPADILCTRLHQPNLPVAAAAQTKVTSCEQCHCRRLDWRPSRGVQHRDTAGGVAPYVVLHTLLPCRNAHLTLELGIERRLLLPTTR